MPQEQHRRSIPLQVLAVVLVLGIITAIGIATRGLSWLGIDADNADAQVKTMTSLPPQDSNEEATTEPVEEDAEPVEEDVAALLARAGTDGSFQIAGAVNLNLNYSVMPYSLPLNPAGPQATMVRWVDGLGYSPNKAADGTVYVLGHAWSRAPLALNPVSELVVATVDWSNKETVVGTDGGPVTRYYSNAMTGSEIAMTNDQGYTQRWMVDSSFIIPKYDAIADPELLLQEVPGKIVVMACAVADDADLEYNVVLVGHLV